MCVLQIKSYEPVHRTKKKNWLQKSGSPWGIWNDGWRCWDIKDWGRVSNSISSLGLSSSGNKTLLSLNSKGTSSIAPTCKKGSLSYFKRLSSKGSWKGGGRWRRLKLEWIPLFINPGAHLSNVIPAQFLKIKQVVTKWGEGQVEQKEFCGATIKMSMASNLLCIWSPRLGGSWREGRITPGEISASPLESPMMRISSGWRPLPVVRPWSLLLSLHREDGVPRSARLPWNLSGHGMFHLCHY